MKYLWVILLGTLFSSCTNTARDSVRTAPVRLETQYNVHFTEIRIAFSPREVMLDSRYQSPHETHFTSPISEETFRAIVDELLSTELFTEENDFLDGRGFFSVKLTYSDGTQVARGCPIEYFWPTENAPKKLLRLQKWYFRYCQDVPNSPFQPTTKSGG